MPLLFLMIDLADVLGGVHQLEAAALAATSTECATKWAKVSKSASKRQVKAQLAHLGKHRNKRDLGVCCE
jgi:hypothetical protein